MISLKAWTSKYMLVVLHNCKSIKIFWNIKAKGQKRGDSGMHNQKKTLFLQKS